MRADKKTVPPVPFAKLHKGQFPIPLQHWRGGAAPYFKQGIKKPCRMSGHEISLCVVLLNKHTKGLSNTLFDFSVLISAIHAFFILFSNIGA